VAGLGPAALSRLRSTSTAPISMASRTAPAPMPRRLGPCVALRRAEKGRGYVRRGARLHGRALA
jgi:hypothetical protein